MEKTGIPMSDKTNLSMEKTETPKSEQPIIFVNELQKQKLEKGKEQEFELQCLPRIPYAKKEEMAGRYVGIKLVTDEYGNVFDSYRAPLYWTFLIAEYYTNIDTAPLDNEDGWIFVYEYLRNKRLEVNEGDHFSFEHYQLRDDIGIVDTICQYMERAILLKADAANSLSRKVGKLFDQVLSESGEELTTQLAKSQAVSEKLIDMLSILKDANREKDKVNAVGNGALNFAKK